MKQSHPDPRSKFMAVLINYSHCSLSFSSSFIVELLNVKLGVTIIQVESQSYKRRVRCDSHIVDKSNSDTQVSPIESCQ